MTFRFAGSKDPASYVLVVALMAAVTMEAGSLDPASQSPKVSSRVIDAPQLIRDLQVLSADDMEGRVVGTPGGEKARAYVIERFKASGLQPFGTTFEQPFMFTAGRGGQAAERKGVNVVGRIEGTRNPDQYIVITAHYDHIPARNGQISNGADDNASGTAALFALAKYFSVNKPATSLIFAALDAEEVGLRGARAFVASPPVPLDKLAINLNMDMIGRDPNDLLYVVGTTAQPFLKPFIGRVAAKAPVILVMGHDDPAQKGIQDWTSMSDQKAFCDAKVPCLYFGVEDFENHHRVTDDFETMTYHFYVRVAETMVLAVKEFDANLDMLLKGRSK